MSRDIQNAVAAVRGRKATMPAEGDEIISAVQTAPDSELAVATTAYIIEAGDSVEEDIPLSIPTRIIQHPGRLQGMQVPSNGDYANLTAGEREAWLCVMEEAMSRGVNSPSELTRLTGLSMNGVSSLRATVYDMWGKSASPQLVNQRREQLFYEVERVKQNAWDYFERGKNSGRDIKEQGALLKLVLDAVGQQAKMSGVNNINVNVQSEISATFKTNADFEREAASLLKVDGEVLKDLGSLLAQNMGEDEDE
jgi:hypothetical protein